MNNNSQSNSSHVFQTPTSKALLFATTPAMGGQGGMFDDDDGGADLFPTASVSRGVSTAMHAGSSDGAGGLCMMGLASTPLTPAGGGGFSTPHGHQGSHHQFNAYLQGQQQQQQPQQQQTSQCLFPAAQQHAAAHTSNNSNSATATYSSSNHHQQHEQQRAPAAAAAMPNNHHSGNGYADQQFPQQQQQLQYGASFRALTMANNALSNGGVGGGAAGDRRQSGFQQFVSGTTHRVISDEFHRPIEMPPAAQQQQQQQPEQQQHNHSNGRDRNNNNAGRQQQQQHQQQRNHVTAPPPPPQLPSLYSSIVASADAAGPRTVAATSSSQPSSSPVPFHLQYDAAANTSKRLAIHAGNTAADYGGGDTPYQQQQQRHINSNSNNASSAATNQQQQPIVHAPNAQYEHYAMQIPNGNNSPAAAFFDGGGGSNGLNTSGGANQQNPYYDYSGPGPSAFTQAHAATAQAPSFILQYLQSVRDGSFEQRQRQLQELQRYGGCGALDSSLVLLGGGAGDSPSAAAAFAQQHQNQNQHLPPALAAAPLSGNALLKKQQEAMERKKAANLQRWMAYGKAQVPEHLVQHHRQHLEELAAIDEARRKKVAALSQLGGAAGSSTVNGGAVLDDTTFAPMNHNTNPTSTNNSSLADISHTNRPNNSDAPSTSVSAMLLASPRGAVSNGIHLATTNNAALSSTTDYTASSSAAASSSSQQQAQQQQQTAAVPFHVMMADVERKALEEKMKQKKKSSSAAAASANAIHEGPDSGDAAAEDAEGGRGRGRGGRGGRGGFGSRFGKKTTRSDAASNNNNNDETQDSQSAANTPANATAPAPARGGKGTRKKNAAAMGGSADAPAPSPIGGGFILQPNRTLLSFGRATAGNNNNAGAGGGPAGTVQFPLPPVEVVAWVPGVHSCAVAAGDKLPRNIPPTMTRVLTQLMNHFDDPNAVGAPLVCLVPEININMPRGGGGGSTAAAAGQMLLTTGPVALESSFSLCSKHDGKILFTPTDSPRDAANLLHRLYVYYNGSAYELDQPSAYCFINTILTADIESELVTFHASALLMPLLSYNGGAFAASNIGDVRAMAWMLNPSNTCPDFDGLIQQHGGPHHSNAIMMTSQQLSPANTRSGILQRLPLLMDVYQRLYGALGQEGMLPTYMRQEKRVGLICCMMKFNGFCVRTDLAEACRLTTERRMEELKGQAEAYIRQHTRFFEEHGGGAFNIQSTKDLQCVLFTCMQLEKYLYHDHNPSNGFLLNPRFRTGGGKYSTSEEVLKHLSKYEHAFVPLIRTYRKIAKLSQTYFHGMLANANLFPFYEEDEAAAGDDATIGGKGDAGSGGKHLCCVHANFNQVTTDTGRLSCVDPNIQNLPRVQEVNFNAVAANSPTLGSAMGGGGGGEIGGFGGSDNTTATASSSSGNLAANPIDVDIDDEESDALLATAVRASFVARPGHKLVAIDYEQIELRVLAHLSHDPKLLHVLSSDDPLVKDIHKRIAAEVFSKPAALITAEERSQAKRVVFGTLYGAGPGAFAAEMGITEARAKAIQDYFWRAFPTIRRFHQDVLSKCRAAKEVRTITHRLRRIPDINNTAQAGARAAAERQAFNTCIQGSAADIMKQAMVGVFNKIICAEYDSLTPSSSSSSAVSMGDRPLLLCQIHDELVFSIPKPLLTRLVPRIRAEMTSCFRLQVPLKVSVKVGDSLGTLSDWTLDMELGLEEP